MAIATAARAVQPGLAGGRYPPLDVAEVKRIHGGMLKISSERHPASLTDMRRVVETDLKAEKIEDTTLLSFELLLELGEEAPVGALSDDRLGGTLDHPRLV